jgi:hypothetical protein
MRRVRHCGGEKTSPLHSHFNYFALGSKISAATKLNNTAAAFMPPAKIAMNIYVSLDMEAKTNITDKLDSKFQSLAAN